MKKVILMIITGCVLLSGCGVSQEDYDRLEKKNEDLSKELKEQKQEYAELEDKNKELNEQREEQTSKEMAMAVPIAWAQTHFGQDCIVFANNNEYLQIISKQEYNLASSSVKEIWQKMLDSANTLGTMLDKINYNRIAVKFPKVGGANMLEFVIKRDGETYTFESWSMNSSDITVLLPALEQAVR